ncbi:hypothetical protein ACP70R_013450 [Stipagrostis hirtigluma subsp. patula]
MMLPAAELDGGGANGGGLPALPDFTGGKSKYVRMGDVLPQEQEGVDGGGVRVRQRQSSKRYVFSCSVFASLNSVLLGYGEFDQSPLSNLHRRSFTVLAEEEVDPCTSPHVAEPMLSRSSVYKRRIQRSVRTSPHVADVAAKLCLEQ